MKKNILASLVIIVSLIVFNNITYAQKSDKKADSKVLTITDNDFDKTIKKGITMVDFWAVWCGPCRRQGPIVEEIAGQFSDKVNIFKCNVDDNPVSPTTYGVKAIPTLIFFKNGQVVEQITGMASKSKLEEIINKISV